MKARIEKKLSKRLVQIAPTLFKGWWVEDERAGLAWKQGSCVSHVPMVGGEVDYWGEGQDAYTVWADWLYNYYWSDRFSSYPVGHKFEGYPDTTGFKPTTKNLLRLAAEQEERLVNRRKRGG